MDTNRVILSSPLEPPKRRIAKQRPSFLWWEDAESLMLEANLKQCCSHNESITYFYLIDSCSVYCDMCLENVTQQMFNRSIIRPDSVEASMTLAVAEAVQVEAEEEKRMVVVEYLE